MVRPGLLNCSQMWNTSPLYFSWYSLVKTFFWWDILTESPTLHLYFGALIEDTFRLYSPPLSVFRVCGFNSANIISKALMASLPCLVYNGAVHTYLENMLMANSTNVTPSLDVEICDMTIKSASHWWSASVSRPWQFQSFEIFRWKCRIYHCQCIWWKR